MEKTSDLIKYAKKRGVSITMPKFGISASGYSFDKDRKIIAKGMSAIKHIGKKLAEELHEVSQGKKYTSFVELLGDLKEKTSIDSQQLSILIHIDFFSDFGNQRELDNIVYFWEFFKRGTAKQIKKDKIAGSYIEDIVKRHSTDKKKDGSEASSYTLNDELLIQAGYQTFRDSFLRFAAAYVFMNLVKNASDRIRAELYSGTFVECRSRFA